MKPLDRRTVLKVLSAGPLAGALAFGRRQEASPEPGVDFEAISDACRKFIEQCRRDDGGYSASPDLNYPGNSDTNASDLAAVTYAAVLAKTMGWELPSLANSIAFVAMHQQPDGRFRNLAGEFDPESELAVLYNTTQGVVALRALGALPDYDPTAVLDPFFENDRFAQLPLYTTSFFPLFYAALGTEFPPGYKQAVKDFMIASQGADGYLQDHVAATFHMAHFFRMIGEPTPRADAMVTRTLADQTNEGGWNIKEPDWDVHACFDALFILHQLGGDAPACRTAMDKAAEWVVGCRNDDGGFGHFPGWHSDMDAVYFQFGSLIQAGKIPGARTDIPDANTLSWGHAMQPGKIYSNFRSTFKI